MTTYNTSKPFTPKEVERIRRFAEEGMLIGSGDASRLIATIDHLRAQQLLHTQAGQPDPSCTICHGTGAADSGGVTPWGDGIDVRCGCTYPENLRAQQPTAIHDPEKLWEKHRLALWCLEPHMDKEAFLAALAEAESEQEAIAKRFEKAALDNETAAKAAQEEQELTKHQLEYALETVGHLQQQAIEAKADFEQAEKSRATNAKLLDDAYIRLAEAKAEGRREGLEEAAEICDRIEDSVARRVGNKAYNETEAAHSECAALCALSIRALLESQTPSPKLEDGGKG